MSATAEQPGRVATDSPEALVVTGVRDARSLGVALYSSRLARALVDERIEYRLEERAARDAGSHFHLANSSRALLAHRPARASAYVVTAHDVVPRTRALLPLYRALAYPRVARAAVIVHSSFAADMLVKEAGRRPTRLEVIPHPAQRPPAIDRSEARRALGWPEDALIAAIPGVIKSVKLAREALIAASAAPGWRLALAGRLVDRRVADAARAEGALVLGDPSDVDYQRAIVASDCVLCLRAGSVGESNGPLLDALGAARAVLATATGSIPEVAGDSALYCDRTAASIRSGLAVLADSCARAQFEQAASMRAEGLTWRASAALHAVLFREVFN